MTNDQILKNAKSQIPKNITRRERSDLGQWGFFGHWAFSLSHRLRMDVDPVSVHSSFVVGSTSYDLARSMSVGFALGQDFAVSLSRVFVILLCLRHLVGLDEALLLRPTLIHAFQAPFGAPFGGAHRLVGHQHPDWVGMRTWRDTRRDPTASLDLRVENQVAQSAVRQNLLLRHRITIHDELDHNF